MLIRLLTPRDAADYRSFRLAGLEESAFAFSDSHADESRRSIADFAAEIATQGDPPRAFTLGAFWRDRGLRGVVSFRADERRHALHKGMLTAMYVHPEQRGSGMGSALLTELLVRARRLPGLEQIHLWVLVRPGAPSAVAFYERAGFVAQGPAVAKDMKIHGEYVDAQYMTLEL